MAIDQYIRLKRLAKLLDVHPKTVGRWVKEGKFPRPFVIGGEPRWKETDVMLYLEKQRQESAGEETLAENDGTEVDRREHLGTSEPKPKKPR